MGAPGASAGASRSGAGDDGEPGGGRTGLRDRYHSDQRVIVERIPFLSGNEAIARGAVRAGLGFACGYPGTPVDRDRRGARAASRARSSSGASTRRWPSRRASARRWPARALIVTMKHVGLNVAADPFMTLALTGVNAGLVVVSADDPGMHSSQNEQDNRHFAAFAKVPMLEPSDSQEAYDFVAWAFELSEEFDTPVLLRSTTRVSHGRGRVVPRAPLAVERARLRQGHRQVRDGPRVRARAQPPRARPPRAAAPPRRGVAAERARGRHDRHRHHRLGRRLHLRPRGVSQGLVPQAGHVAPAALRKVAKLYESVSRVFVVEELDPFLEDQVRALGLPVVGKEVIPRNGELDQEIVFDALEPLLKRRPPRRKRAVFPPAPVIAPAPAAGRRPAGAAAGAVPRLPAPRRLRHAAPREGRRHGRHRLLHARRPAAAAVARELRAAWAPSVGMMAGINRAHGTHRRGGRDRRLDLLPLRHHPADRRPLQRDAAASSSCSTTAPPP